MPDRGTRRDVAARALGFTDLTAARLGETRMATWAKLDLDASKFRLPPHPKPGRRTQQ
ncbi:hypothetical protein NBRC116594_25240 [Shimia sp. NS0008-38b]